DNSLLRRVQGSEQLDLSRPLPAGPGHQPLRRFPAPPAASQPGHRIRGGPGPLPREVRQRLSFRQRPSRSVDDSSAHFPKLFAPFINPFISSCSSLLVGPRGSSTLPSLKETL